MVCVDSSGLRVAGTDEAMRNGPIKTIVARAAQLDSSGSSPVVTIETSKRCLVPYFQQRYALSPHNFCCVVTTAGPWASQDLHAKPEQRPQRVAPVPAGRSRSLETWRSLFEITVFAAHGSVAPPPRSRSDRFG